MQWINFNRPAFLAGIVVLSLTVGAATAAVTINSIDETNDIYAAQEELDETANLSVSDVTLTYSGLNVSSMDVTVSSSDSTNSHNFDIHVRAWNSSSGGETLFSATNASESVTADGTTTVTYSGLDYRVDTFDTIDVNIEETG